MYRLDLQCFAPPFRFSLRTMRFYLSQTSAMTLIAESYGALVGFVITERDVEIDPAAVYVITLDVDLNYRRQGIAAALLDAAERQANEDGARSMWLHVHTQNEAAVLFYEDRGYRRETRTPNFYGTGVDAFVYVRALG